MMIDVTNVAIREKKNMFKFKSNNNSIWRIKSF